MTSPEIHDFVLWSRARSKADRILEDIAERFVIRDVVEVAWTQERFADNLTRFYLQQLPAGSDKQKHCGTDPFLVVVVEDRRPSYRPHQTAKGLLTVNANTFDAKERYRAWTRGGHRIHASISAREGDHDLLLLLGRRAHDYRDSRGWDGTVRPHSSDLVGAQSWASLNQLLEAVELTMTYVLLTPQLDVAHANESIDLLVEDAWWAGVLLDRNPSGHDISMSRQDVVVAGQPLTVRLHSGTEGLDPRWYGEIIRNRSRLPNGAFVAREIDWFYCILHQAISGRTVLDDRTLACLREIAGTHSLPSGDFRDLAFSGSVLHEFLRASGYDYVVENDNDPTSDGTVAPRARRLRRFAFRRLRFRGGDSPEGVSHG